MTILSLFGSVRYMVRLLCVPIRGFDAGTSSCCAIRGEKPAHMLRHPIKHSASALCFHIVHRGDRLTLVLGTQIHADYLLAHLCRQVPTLQEIIDIIIA